MQQSRLKLQHPDWFSEDLTTLLTLLENHQIKPRIAACFPLMAASQAHQLLEQGGTEGQIVLLCT